MSTDQGSNIFNVQDSDDFKERVLQSKIPTVVDFHAEYVCNLFIHLFICLFIYLCLFVCLFKYESEGYVPTGE